MGASMEPNRATSGAPRVVRRRYSTAAEASMTTGATARSAKAFAPGLPDQVGGRWEVERGQSLETCADFGHGGSVGDLGHLREQVLTEGLPRCSSARLQPAAGLLRHVADLHGRHAFSICHPVCSLGCRWTAAGPKSSVGLSSSAVAASISSYAVSTRGPVSMGTGAVSGSPAMPRSVIRRAVTRTRLSRAPTSWL